MTTPPTDRDSAAPGAQPPATSRFRMPWPILMVIGVALLVFGISLVLPAFQQPGSGPREVCSNYMRNVAQALRQYHVDHGSFPPAYVADAEGRPMHSWRIFLLPYLERKDLFDHYDFNEPWNSPKNAWMASQMPAFFRCPQANGADEITNFVAVVGQETAWPGTRCMVLSDITDGAEQTILLVEIADSDIHWMEPRDLTLEQALRGVNRPNNSGGISGRHLGGTNAFLCNGGYRHLKNEIPPDVLKALFTVSGGEVVTTKD